MVTPHPRRRLGTAGGADRGSKVTTALETKDREMIAAATLEDFKVDCQTTVKQTPIGRATIFRHTTASSAVLVDAGGDNHLQ